ncbi:hypothetical protein P7K49_002953, partial [Saguinus oedipus]
PPLGSPSRGAFKRGWCFSQSLVTPLVCAPLWKPRRRFPRGPSKSCSVVEANGSGGDVVRASKRGGQ